MFAIYPSDKVQELKLIYNKETTQQKVGEGYEQVLLKIRHLCGQQIWKKAQHRGH